MEPQEQELKPAHTDNDNEHFTICLNEGSQWITWNSPVLTVFGMALLWLVLGRTSSVKSFTFDLRNAKSTEGSALVMLCCVAEALEKEGCEVKFVTPPSLIWAYLRHTPIADNIINITN